MLLTCIILTTLLIAASVWMYRREQYWQQQLHQISTAAGLTSPGDRTDALPNRIVRLLADSHELHRQEYLRKIFETLLNEIQQGVVIVDERLQIKFANRTIARLFHRPTIQRNRPLLDEIQDHQLHATLQSALQNRRRVVGDMRFVSTGANSGGITGRHYSLEAAPLPSTAEGGAWLMVQDMTDQVMAEQIRKDFVANASHELRTPLTLILGYIETLREGVDGDPEFISKCLGIMEKHGQRIVRIIDDMLTISRLEGTSGILNMEPFPVRACVQDAVDRLAPLLEGRDTQIVLDFPDNGGIINGDRFYWDQLFTNLIENAVKENPAPGLIVRVTGQWSPRSCTLTIADNGVGIPAHEIPFIFKRFYRGGRHHASGIKGTGLGLSIVRRAVEAHGGTIDLRSTPGQETVFTIRLPLSDAPGVEPSATDEVQ